MSSLEIREVDSRVDSRVDANLARASPGGSGRARATRRAMANDECMRE